MIDGLDVHNTLLDKPWHWWAAATLEKSIPTGKYVVEVVKVYEEDGESSYGYEAPQGWSGEASIVFKVYQKTHDVNEGPFFFKKFGTINSYYSTAWDGKFIPVAAREKKVVEYVYE